MPELPKDAENPTSHGPRSGPVIDEAYRERLRELELELEKTRSEASAARLDAQAADLELRIQRLGSSVAGGNHDNGAATGLPLGRLERDAATTPLAKSVNIAGHSIPGHSGRNSTSHSFSLPRNRSPRKAVVFKRSHASRRDDETHPDHNETNKNIRAESESIGSQRAINENAETSNDDCGALVPLVRSWNDVRRLIGADGSNRDEQRPLNVGTATCDLTDERRAEHPAGPDRKTTKSPDGSSLHLDLSHAEEPENSAVGFEVTRKERETPGQGRRRGAWLMSAIFHGLLLMLLALFGLSSTPPGDQIAIAGSVAETDELAVETLEIETEQVQPASSEPTPTETALELSEIGEFSVTDLISDAPPAPPSPLIDSLSTRDAISAAKMSMLSNSDSTIEFCGVEGGGNHFVYLVDSSGSMGNAFDSAREELLRSISVLKPSQRFYVIFFDAESDYMRLASPNRDEPRSVFATPENKQLLRRWAMTIKMDRGRAPYDALPFALDLSPDVIFLLSDGEFPQKIEDLLKDINRIDNLFGDEGPISIVHTIGYHSRDGESRMRRIATQNGGRYRHVPKPK